MPGEKDFVCVRAEHDALMLEYGRVQRRTSHVIGLQLRTIERLETEIMRLRVAAVLRETELAWAREDLEAVHAAVPGLPKRLVLARRVVMLEARVQDLVRTQRSTRVPTEPTGGEGQDRSGFTHEAAASSDVPARREKVVLWISQDRRSASGTTGVAAEALDARLVCADGSDAAALDAGLADADIVICQTGCVSHQDYWRVRDHCRRTGKRCVLVERPDALQGIFSSAAPVEMDAAGDKRFPP